MTSGMRTHTLMSILKLFVMFSSGLSSVCHFGHDGEIMGSFLVESSFQPRPPRWL